MGRHFEVRAAAMAATAKAKSAVYMRASKEIYAAAKSGIPDPESNLALRSAIEKYRKTTPRDVIERAIEKAKGSDSVAYIEGRYEFFGPGGCLIVVDTLSDNVNRALTSVRTIVTRKGGKMGSVLYNFQLEGVMDFKGDDKMRQDVEDNLVLGDVDVTNVTCEDGEIEAQVNPSDLAKAQDVLKGMGITDFDASQVALIPNDYVSLEADDLAKMKDMLSELDECEDVQNVYHNVENI
jgi:YebC/PmpR family DNA-binding regulatory protein